MRIVSSCKNSQRRRDSCQDSRKQLINDVITDTEAPRIACGRDQLVNTDKGKPTTMIVWQDHAVDNSGGVPGVTCDPQSGENFSIGQTTVTCEAVDGSGNRAECHFRVNVTGV